MVEDSIGFPTDSQTVNIIQITEGFECNYQIEAFLCPDAAKAKDIGHVDDANTTHLDETAGKFFGVGLNLITDFTKNNHVIGDKGASTL